ncbi:MAG: Foldase protein PrsA precursor [Actinobacteria bacterium ADurb.Bin346]|nr:MAG: Foldase protein PrsA precursor [Actinobacteria bacterium ADurb.Bin346]
MDDKEDIRKDNKEIYHWDEEPVETSKNEIKVKRSKKVVKREAKEAEKKRKLEIQRERQKTRLSKGGKIGLIIGAVVAVLGFTAWLLFFYLGIGLDLTKTYAKFDGGKVTQKEMDDYIEFLKNQNPASVPAESDPKYTVLRKNLLDSIIVMKLIENYAADNKIIVTDKEVTDEISSLIKNYESEAAFEKKLKDMKITKAFLKDQVKSQLLRDKVFAAATSGVAVSDTDAKKYYDENAETLFMVPEQVKVSHILIKFNIPEGQELNDAIKAEAKEKILSIQKQLKDGADFAELAKKYSDDTASAPNGGDIGFISRGQTVPEFEKAAFDLGVGQVSDIAETTFGYHIIKCVEKQAPYLKAYDEVKDTIKSYLLNNKQLSVWEDFVYSIVDKAGIVYSSSLKGQLLEPRETAIETTSTDTTTAE